MFVKSLLCVCLLLVSVSAYAQKKSPETDAAIKAAMTFDNEAQMIRMIEANQKDLRRTFYIILHSRDKKLSEAAADQYRKMWFNVPNNPITNAEYAFCHAVATTHFAYDRPTAKQKRLQKELYSYFSEAEQCREMSLKGKPKSPEVALMAAMGYYEQRPAIKDVPLIEKAIALDPDWAFPHYWLGRTFVNVAGPFPSPKQAQYCRKAIAEFQKTQLLDPSFTILRDYIYAYDGLKQYDKSLVYINRRLAAISQNGGSDLERKELLRMRTAAEAKLKAQGTKPAMPKS